MASTKTVSKGIRMTNEADEYYRDKPLNRIAEALIPHLESGRIVFDGEDLKIYGVSAGIMGEIEEIALLYGITLESMMRQFCDLLNNGTLVVEGGVLKVDL